jgi:hypothetical protein
MRTRPVIEGTLLLTLVACSPSGYATGRPQPCPYSNPEQCKPQPGEEGTPPAPGVSPGTKVSDDPTFAEMSHWLGMFRERQGLYYAEHLRYAKDVTVGGSLAPLPSPYKTDYQIHQTERNYSITVRHEPTLQRCYLQDGETIPGTPVQDAGQIICGRY